MAALRPEDATASQRWPAIDIRAGASAKKPIADELESQPTASPLLRVHHLDGFRNREDVASPSPDQGLHEQIVGVPSDRSKLHSWFRPVEQPNEERSIPKTAEVARELQHPWTTEARFQILCTFPSTTAAARRRQKEKGAHLQIQKANTRLILRAAIRSATDSPPPPWKRDERT